MWSPNRQRRSRFLLLGGGVLLLLGCTWRSARPRPGAGSQPEPPAARALRELEPALQRELLGVLNAAQRPQDLVDIDPELISEEAARRVIELRDSISPMGFLSVDQLLELDPTILDGMAAHHSPSQIGRWTVLPYNLQFPDGTLFSMAHAAVLHTGDVLFLIRDATVDTVLWDPSDEANPQFSSPVNQPGNPLFCAGHSFLSDGNLLVVGGGGWSPADVRAAWKFDPVARRWTQTAGSMDNPRWYPTAVTLGDGRVFVASGSPTDKVEIYDPSSDSFSPVTGPPANPSGADRDFPELYPGLHLLPNGEIFFSRTGWGHGNLEPTVLAQVFRFSGPNVGEWNDVADTMNSADRTEGMSVILHSRSDPQVRVMVAGGGDPSQTGRNKAELINLSATPPVWTPPTLLPDERFNVNAVLLPDGNTLVVGGRNVQNSPALLFDETTRSWSQMATVTYRREYHSVAILLPNAKVMTTGGDSNANATQRTAIEIFSPPYLFRVRVR